MHVYRRIEARKPRLSSLGFSPPPHETKKKADQLLRDVINYYSPYDNEEEQRVIDNVETPYIQAVNKATDPLDLNQYQTPQQEGTRTDHRGDPYKTDGVNSITPADGSSAKGQSESKVQNPADKTNVVK